MNQLNQNIIRNKNCLKCYKIEKKLPEKWEHFQNIMFNSQIFTVWENKHTEISQIKPMIIFGSLGGSFSHIHPANPTTYYQNNYKITKWEKTAEPRKITGYNLVVISDLIKNQGEYHPFELKSKKEWENILEFYRDLFNRGKLTFEKTEHIQDFLREFQRNEVRGLTNELEEVRTRYDKVCDLCFKLIEKMLAEKGTKTKSFWEKVEKIKSMLELIGIPTNIILLTIELLKNKTGS